MSILIPLIFVSLVFVALALLLFRFSVINEDLDHSTQLSLKPLEDDRD